jgi:VanZ family protein
VQPLVVDDELPTRRQQRLLGIVCIIALVAVLIATLWPFDFSPANRVSWLPYAAGIQFLRPGFVVSKAPLTAERAATGESCSLEVLLRPAGVRSLSLLTILNIYNPSNPTRFLLQQWRDDVAIARDVVEVENKSQKAQFYVPHVLQAGKVVLLTLTTGPSGTVVYINDRQVMRVFPTFAISQSDCAGNIVLGNSATTYSSWPGEIRGLAMYSKALTPTDVFRHYREWTDGRVVSADMEGAMARYDFSERAGRDIHNAVVSGPDLEIPVRFKVLDKPLLQSPRKEMMENESYLHDALVNIAGFVPLGFVICAYWRCSRGQTQALLYTILGAAILSFLIEVLQAYIPQRGSGVSDIITNTMGAALGAVLARPAIVRAIFGTTKSITAGSSVARQDPL